MRVILICAITAGLSACGGGGGGSAAPASTTIAPALVAPVVYAGGDRAAMRGSEVTVDGTASSYSDDSIVSFSWMQTAGPTVTLTNAAFQPNDSPAEAQTISNPVTLGSYVNRPGAGEPGRSQVDGDVSDFYRVALVAGETITLLVAEPTVGDVDLYLWDASGTTELNLSISPGQFEQLTVPSTGEFLVEATSFSGASNYILIIGQAQPSVSVGGFRLSDDFIPGDVIVRYRDDDVAPAGQTEQTRVESTHRLSRRAGARNRAMLMRFGQRAGLTSQDASFGGGNRSTGGAT